MKRPLGSSKEDPPAKTYHREPSSWECPTPTVKCYRNEDYMNSPHARHLRILAEYEEPMQRLAANGVTATIQFFGSARSKDREQYDAAVAKANALADESERAAALEKLRPIEWMCEYMAKTRELARRITEWSCEHSLKGEHSVVGVSRTKEMKGKGPLYSYPKHVTESRASRTPSKLAHPPAEHANGDGERDSQALFVCTGGAGGFMEAANRGAADVPGGRSIGMGISLPFERGLNPYVTPELAFEFHYFFTRKLAMAFHMQALVVAPGGFGTCDEMFELMVRLPTRLDASPCTRTR